VTALTVRAGDRRISRRDRLELEDSWRRKLESIANRPTVDTDWEHVLHYDLE
jgi:hypothetical protein